MNVRRVAESEKLSHYAGGKEEPMPEFEFQESRIALQKVRYTVAAENRRAALRLIAAHQVTPVPVGPAVLIHAGELEPLKPTVVATYDGAGCPIWHNLEQSAAVL